MGFIVRAKRIDISDSVINCSFALDFVNSETLNSINGIYSVEGGDVLVGCTEKGKLCIQGSSINLDWVDVSYVVSFTNAFNGTESIVLTTKELIETPLRQELGEATDSDIVGIGKVGYMVLRY